MALNFSIAATIDLSSFNKRIFSPYRRCCYIFTLSHTLSFSTTFWNNFSLIGCLVRDRMDSQNACSLALPLCAGLIFRPGKIQRRLPAILGVALLFTGAFVEALHDFEVTITVIGAIFLGFAHLQNLRKGRHKF